MQQSFRDRRAARNAQRRDLGVTVAAVAALAALLAGFAWSGRAAWERRRDEAAHPWRFVDFEPNRRAALTDHQRMSTPDD